MWCHPSRSWFQGLLVAMLVCSATAEAGYDSFALGTGRDGALVVSSSGTVVNRYATVTAAAAAGGTSIAVDSVAGFGAGDLILVLQTAGFLPVPASGSTGILDLNLVGSPVGRWELARLESVGGGGMVMTEPLIYSYAAGVSQVIRVPEYSSVQVQAGASIVASPWDGSRGGVIAFLVSGSLTNNGRIDAGGQGFRGGRYVNDRSGSVGCTGLDQAAPQGAQKGEGLSSDRYGANHTGRGNIASSGGGGVCLRSGGAGGSGSGRGGKGGFSHSSLDGARDVGGLPGMLVSYAVNERLIFGGGGGSGHGSDGAWAGGGNGGGAIMIRADTLSGNGTITAEGSPGQSTFSADGAGGGGAGGSIFLRFAGAANCSQLIVKGGDGGETNAGTAYVGPGGGGGGGQVRLQSASGTCAMDSFGGFSGLVQDNAAPGGFTYGAAVGSNGVESRITPGFRVPTVPTLTSPANGAVSASAFPRFSGRAEPQRQVVFFINGVRNGGVLADASGNYEGTVATGLPDGVYQIQVASELQGAWSVRSSAVSITVDTLPPAEPVIVYPQAPGSTTNNRTPTVNGTAEPGSTVTLFSNGAQVATTTAAPSTGQWSFNMGPLAEGYYELRVTSRDEAGNTSSSQRVGLEIDLTPPAPPQLLSPNQGSLTRERNPVISGTAELLSRVTLFVDDVEADSVTYSTGLEWSVRLTQPLADGTHTLRARATDVAGNSSEFSAVRSFVVDATPPDTSFTRTPPAVVAERVAYFELQANEPAFAYECNLDDAGFDFCTARPEYRDLADGQHTLQVRATDRAGNTDPTPAIYTWRVDTVAPDTSIVSGPPARGFRTSAAFSFSSNESGVRYDCSLDGAAFDACPVPATFTNLAPGSHTLQVRARDEAGNVDSTPASYTWSVEPDLDSDEDGLKDSDEEQRGTDPSNKDSDGGGREDGKEVQAGLDPLNPDDDFEFAGLSCAAAGVTPLLPLALLLALPRRRRQPRQPGRQGVTLGGGLVALLVTLLASPASAQGIDIQQYKPAPGSRDVLGVYSAKVGEEFTPHGAVSVNYGSGVLGVRDPVDGTIVHNIVPHQVTLDLLFSMGITNWLELGAVLPATLHAGQPAGSFGGFFPGTGAGIGLGDIRLVPKLSLPSTDEGLSLGLVIPVSIPTAGGQGFRGGAGVGVQPMLMAQWQEGKQRWRVLANAGVRLQPEGRLRNLRVGNEFTYALGFDIPFTQEEHAMGVRLSAEGALGLNGPTAAQTPLEALGAFYFPLPQQGWTVQMGLGRGLLPGYGSPSLRAFASVSLTPPASKAQPHEPDPVPEPRAGGEQPGDGKAPPVVQLQPAPEPRTAPEPDPDGDGVNGEKDKCPNEAEDVNGFKDDDGCPDRGVSLEADSIVLKDKIVFEKNSGGKESVAQQSEEQLKALAAFLKAKEDLKVRVEVHTDESGNARANLSLSERRAKLLVDYLADAGVDRSRLTGVGKGQNSPIVQITNGMSKKDREEAREKNRRVEFTILKDGAR